MSFTETTVSSPSFHLYLKFSILLIPSAFITIESFTLDILTVGMFFTFLPLESLYIAYEPCPIKNIPKTISAIAKNLTIFSISTGPELDLFLFFF